MDEDRKGYENYIKVNNQPSYGVKGKLRRDEDNTLWNIDPYLQASWQFLPTWRLDTGLRYSNVHYKSDDQYIVGVNGDDSGKTEYSKVLPSAALSRQIQPELLAYISYAKGFETPTFTEMAYNSDPDISGFNFDLNASTDTYEAGLKSQNRLGDFTLAAFQTKTKDDIVSAGSINGRATFRNADKTLREGIELTWNKALWRDLVATASYGYLDATFDADVPHVEALLPLHQAIKFRVLQKIRAMWESLGSLKRASMQGSMHSTTTKFMSMIKILIQHQAIPLWQPMQVTCGICKHGRSMYLDEWTIYSTKIMSAL